jgi:hypothetical protein
MKRFTKILIYLYVFFMVIDPGGQGALTYLPGTEISVKYILLFLICIIGAGKLILALFNGRTPRNAFFVECVSLFAFAVTFILLGFVRGNDANYIIKDSLGFLYYVPALLMIPLMTEKKDLRTIIFVFLFGVMMVNIALFIIEYLVSSGILPVEIVNILMLRYSIGLTLTQINDSLYRVMLRSGIFVQFAASILFSLIVFNEGKKRMYAVMGLVMCLMALLILFSRGYWLGVIVSVLMSLFMFSKSKAVKIMLMSFMSLFFIIMLIVGMSGATFENPFSERYFSSFNFAYDSSNMIRAEQFYELSIGISEHPFIGSGYGPRIEGYDRNQDQPFIYELDYVSMVMKFGYLGFIALVGIFTSFMIKQYRAISAAKECFERTVLIGIFSGLVGFFLTAATNPYLNGLLGNFIILLAMMSANPFLLKGNNND